MLELDGGLVVDVQHGQPREERSAGVLAERVVVGDLAESLRADLLDVDRAAGVGAEEVPRGGDALARAGAGGRGHRGLVEPEQGPERQGGGRGHEPADDGGPEPRGGRRGRGLRVAGGRQRSGAEEPHRSGALPGVRGRARLGWLVCRAPGRARSPARVRGHRQLPSLVAVQFPRVQGVAGHEPHAPPVRGDREFG